MSKRILHRMSACLLAVVVSLTVGGCDAKISMNGLLVSQSEEETKTDTSKADKNVSSVPETETSSTTAAPEITDSSEDVILSSENSTSDKTTEPVSTMYFDSSLSDDMTMPDIIGMTLDEVSSKYPDLNLEVVRQYSDEYGENTVIDQKIPAGRTIRKSTVVSITVSNGTQKIEIPDLSGINIEEAMDKLEKLDLIPKMIYVDNDETDKDAVIYTEPAAHSEVAKNTLVKLYVSMG